MYVSDRSTSGTTRKQVRNIECVLIRLLDFKRYDVISKEIRNTERGNSFISRPGIYCLRVSDINT